MSIVIAPDAFPLLVTVNVSVTVSPGDTVCDAVAAIVSKGAFCTVVVTAFELTV